MVFKRKRKRIRKMTNEEKDWLRLVNEVRKKRLILSKFVLLKNNNSVPFTNGIQNYKNTSYISSIIQNFASSSDLFGFVVDSYKIYNVMLLEKEFEFEFFDEFSKLLIFHYSNIDSVHRMKELVESLFMNKSVKEYNFDKNIEQDAFAFYKWLISYLDKTVAKLKFIASNSNQYSDLNKYCGGMGKFFEFKYRVVNKCKTNHTLSVSSETNFFLKVQVDKHSNLYDALKDLFDEKLISNSKDILHCDSCQKKVVCHSYMQLDHLPKFCLINLNYFEISVSQ